MPGVYLLKQNQINDKTPSDLTYKNIRIDEYVAPATNLNKTVLWNNSPSEAEENKPLQLHFEAVSTNPVTRIEVVMSIGDRWKTITAVSESNNNYRADIPPDMVVRGFLNYRIMVIDNIDTTTFPGGKKGNPWSWDNRDNSTYTIRLVPVNSPLVLWNAETDWESTFKIWNRAITLKPNSDGETALAVTLQQLPDPDPADDTDHELCLQILFWKQDQRPLG